MERRRVFSITLLKIKKSKKMNTQEPITKNEKKIEVTPLKGTPFHYATNGEEKYILTGKVIMETDKDINEAKKWLKEKPWEAIGMMIQAIINEMSNNKK